jgi:hypothetical protein
MIDPKSFNEQNRAPFFQWKNVPGLKQSCLSENLRRKLRQAGFPGH